MKTKNNNNNIHVVTAMRLGGVFIATCIGSGFATGSEFLQFFSVYGIAGAAGALIISCIICVLFTMLLFDAGKELPADKHTAIFSVYFGKTIGTALDWFCVLFVGGCYFIMLTGAGTTLNEYLGWNSTLGSALMALLCVITVLLGLKKMTNVIGAVGPILVIIALVIGINALLKGTGNLADADKLIPDMGFLTAAPNWFISGICYACACMQIVIPVLPPVGATAENRKTALSGAIFGGVAYHMGLACMVFAIFANLELVKGRQVPNLALASLLNKNIANIFVIMILLAIYSSACPMMWSFCTKVFKDEKSCRYKIGVCAFSVISVIAARFFSLAALINFVYSISGYICMLILFGLIIAKSRRKRKETP